ncbi:MAG: helix-turn-helix transcriptional regulator [Lachnospiraceae bacterium]
MVKLFNEKTDENHGVSMADILQYLEKQGIKAERKSIYDDIELLRLYGMDIVCEKKLKNFYYYLASREFELAELKILVDTVQASKFITERKSTELIRKLESLASVHEARELQRHVYVNSRIKTMNESIYYNVDAINSAINQNRQIDFEYYEWSTEKKLVKKSNGDKKGISPWALTWDNENYYLIAYDPQDCKIKHYRVDKMRKIRTTPDARTGQEDYKRIDLGSYTNKVFGMYGGVEENVTLEFANYLIGVVMDRFGKDIMVIPKDKEHFTIHIQVEVSPMFLSWIIGLGNGVKIISPENVVDQIRKEGERIVAQYRK